MKEFLLYVWQLPQNILARFVIVFSGAITIGGCNSCFKSSISSIDCKAGLTTTGYKSFPFNESMYCLIRN
jgi:hypothetical protein